GGRHVFAANGGEGHDEADDEQRADAAGAEEPQDPGGGARAFRQAAASATHAAPRGSSDTASLGTSAFDAAGNDSEPDLRTRRGRGRARQQVSTAVTVALSAAVTSMCSSAD